VESGAWVVTYDLPAVREATPDGPIFIPVGNVSQFSETVVRCLRMDRPSTQRGNAARSWAQIANEDLTAILSAGDRGEVGRHRGMTASRYT
jgi:hypothetical protein